MIYFMKKTTCFLALTILSVSLLLGQTNNGILKIFSDEPIIVYVDQIRLPITQRFHWWQELTM